MSVLSPSPDFEAHDGFLHAVLGLLRASVEVESLAGAVAQAAEVTAPGDATPQPAPDSASPGVDATSADADAPAGHDEVVLHALLGVLALGATVKRTAESWAPATTPTPAPEPPPPARSPARRVEDLLR